MPHKQVLTDTDAGAAAAQHPAFGCSWVGSGRDAAWVSVSGDLDLATATQFDRALRESQLQARLVVVDLRELAFMDSSGMHVLVDASMRARQVGRRLVVLRGPPNVDRVFALTGRSADVEVHDLDPAEPPVQALLHLAQRESNGSTPRPPEGGGSWSSPSRRVPRKAARGGLLSLVLLAVLAITSIAHAQTPPVLLGTADSFAVLAGSTITNTGPSVVNGNLGLHPGTSVTGFPPGTVNGSQHIADAVAEQAKTDLTTAYQDAAGRPLTATAPPDFGGRTVTSGVYRTGSVPSLGLTGNLTLDAQGDPRAVFIFQIESTLTTATDSSVTLINGAQACNVYWQVGSSATLGTRTAFAGNILALTSISVNDAVTVDGRLLARNGAVTLINDTVTRSQCAAGTEPGTGPGGTGPGGTGPGGTGPGTGPGDDPDAIFGPDRTGPVTQIGGLPGLRQPPPRSQGGRRPAFRTVCTTRSFRARIRVSDRAGIRSVRVYLDGRLVRTTRLTRFSIRINVRALRVGRHRITVVALDRAGNRSVTRRRFGRCALRLAAPRFTG